MTRWELSPLLHDTESFQRLRDEVAAARAGAATDGPIRQLLMGSDGEGQPAGVPRLAAALESVVFHSGFVVLFPGLAQASGAAIMESPGRR